MKIKFLDSWDNVPEEFFPIPASKGIPEWYRKMPTYSSDDKIVDKRYNENGDTTTGTAKKCMPFFDAMTAGYYILLPADLNVRLNDDGTHWFEWAGNSEIVQFHPVVQLPNYPKQESREEAFGKFFHPWIIRTPKGYSSLFVPPIHQDLPFKILEGIVDTDSYGDVVLFPFILIDEKFEGLIPAGTPIVQVIPFKRESWSSEIIKYNDYVQKIMDSSSAKIMSLFNDGYKRFFWQRKKYK